MEAVRTPVISNNEITRLKKILKEHLSIKIKNEYDIDNKTAYIEATIKFDDEVISTSREYLLDSCLDIDLGDDMEIV